MPASMVAISPMHVRGGGVDGAAKVPAALHSYTAAEGVGFGRMSRPWRYVEVKYPCARDACVRSAVAALLSADTLAALLSADTLAALHSGVPTACSQFCGHGRE
jgi:hypothetical protein